MKKLFVLGVLSLLLPLLALGCQDTPGAVTPVTKVPSSVTISLTLDDFAANSNIIKEALVGNPGSLFLRLGANPTTGYDWGDATITDMSVLVQTSYNYEGSTNTAIVGAGGTDVLEFDTLKAGITTITLGYSRSTDEKHLTDLYTLTVNVIIK